MSCPADSDIDTDCSPTTGLAPDATAALPDAPAVDGTGPAAADSADAGAANPANPADASGGVRIIKKYPNRRLYDTAASAYVTLAQVKRLVMQFVPFRVRDAKTGEDITRSILLQIILEEEAGGTPLLSEVVLSGIIRFYGHALQDMLMSHLEHSIALLADTQRQMQRHMLVPAGLNPQQAWQQMMQAPVQNMQHTVQGMQHMQEQVQEQVHHMQQVQEHFQRQYMDGMQRWLQALQPRQPDSA